jgi:hypothetical protein
LNFATAKASLLRRLELFGFLCIIVISVLVFLLLAEEMDLLEDNENPALNDSFMSVGEDDDEIEIDGVSDLLNKEEKPKANPTNTHKQMSTAELRKLLFEDAEELDPSSSGAKEELLIDFDDMGQRNRTTNRTFKSEEDEEEKDSAPLVFDEYGFAIKDPSNISALNEQEAQLKKQILKKEETAWKKLLQNWPSNPTEEVCNP